MYALFETEFNVRMVRAEEKIRAEPALEGREKLLKVARGTPLLSVERIAYTYQDEPMELRRGYYRTDTHHYSTPWDKFCMGRHQRNTRTFIHEQHSYFRMNE